MPSLAAQTAKDSRDALPDMRSRQGTCAKCDQTRTIVAKGQCTGCNYGANKDLTRAQVLAKQGEKKTIPALAAIDTPTTPFADQIGKAPCKTPVEEYTKTPEETNTAKCFFCSRVEERDNSVGYINLNDVAHTKDVYICHSCASKSLQDIITAAAATEPGELPGMIGELMYRRALDSRA
jgi:hypothetical protein